MFKKNTLDHDQIHVGAVNGRNYATPAEAIAYGAMAGVASGVGLAALGGSAAASVLTGLGMGAVVLDCVEFDAHVKREREYRERVVPVNVEVLD